MANKKMQNDIEGVFDKMLNPNSDITTDKNNTPDATHNITEDNTNNATNDVSCDSVNDNNVDNDVNITSDTNSYINITIKKKPKYTDLHERKTYYILKPYLKKIEYLKKKYNQDQSHTINEALRYYFDMLEKGGLK